MKTITDWVVCGDGFGNHFLRGINGRGKGVITSRIVRVSGRFRCVTESGSEYQLVGPTARQDVQKLRGDDPLNPLDFLKEKLG